MSLLLLLSGFAAGLVALAYVALILLSPAPPTPTLSEATYRSLDSSAPSPLPSLPSTPATLALSVVVPAYNERKRIRSMLRDTVQYLENRTVVDDEVPAGVEKGSYEVLIVDDGSKDGTAEVVLELAKELKSEFGAKRGNIKVVTLVRNRGKGGATRHGVLHSAGHRILFCDADGASHFPDLALLQAEADQLQKEQVKGGAKVEDVHGVVVGSRAHLVRTEAVVKRSFLRNLLMRLFHTYLYILGIRTIRDTQCGFKLSSRASAAHLYPSLHSPSWIFDCELLLLALLSGIPVREVGIKWQEVDGSKVDLVRDSVGMAVDLLVIRGNYLLGRWSKPGVVELKGGVPVEVGEEPKKSR
ncbi:nucleotide-diphospho-sugar transferase [Leucosporidium creatinivorum]|uniref:dolichyl-phosphate beta-glucosyltransferase n=1 Tax=Leucosporidium creatinivorum TaxID=106004 RepID=A0A1Y2G5S8_9BASI|nr:nucleotide-diphospho-sugar transferase [Leucosporidium creatinivorum]